MGIENSVLITYTPRYPAPQDTVLLEAQSSILDLEQSELVWRANGEIIARGKGVTTANIVAGTLGTETEVEISVAAPDELSAIARATIAPTHIDLLSDSSAYIPPFYRGRPRASAGTSLRLQAAPLFRRGGSNLTDSEINFIWKKNGEVLGSASGRGKSSAIIPVQNLFGTDQITVEAHSLDGVLVNEASFSLSPAKPLLTLYQDHPLFGVMYYKALGANTFVPGSEMTFVAVPYFAQATHAEDPALSYEWRINGRLVPNARQDKITINAANSRGIALLNLTLAHSTNYYLDSRGSWGVTFSEDTSAIDQFGSFEQ